MEGLLMKSRIEVNGDTYVSTAVIKEKFGVKSMTITRWHQKGVLPEPIRVGQQTFFDEREIERRIAGAK